MEYYSAIKRKEILSFVAKWMELEAIMLSEITPDTERQIMHVLAHTWKLKIN
jgi:hypothetical protein